jgi:ribosomal protein S18 acetylase RimI-like enzyme
MDITYTTERDFTKDDVRRLFASVGWVSADYPNHLHAALIGSSMVFSAWAGGRLAGLVRVLDDGSMTAYVHYVLVDPEYQGHGIAGHLMTMVKDHYKDYLYVEVMPEESRNASFYQQHGFSIMQDGVAMQTVNNNFAD